MSSGRSIGVLASVNVVGAVVGVTSSIVIAHVFGTSRVLEIYFAAATLLHLVHSLSQTGQIGDVFLPIYHRIRHEDGVAEAHRAFSVTLNWTVLFAIALTVLLWVGAPAIMKLLVPGFSPEDQRLAATMLRYILPMVPLQIGVSLVHILGNAESWFGKPEAVTVAAQAAILGTLVLFVRPFGFWALILSLWVGLAVQVFGLGAMLRRMGFHYFVGLRHPSFQIASVFSRLFYTMWYVGATQVYAFAMNAALSMLPQGTYAVFKYVQQLYTKTNTVLLRPVGVVLFTHASEASARGYGDLRDMMRVALARNLAIASIAIVGILAGGAPLLGALWGSEKFGVEELALSVRLLQLFFVLLLVEGVGQIARRVTIALGMVRESYMVAAGMQILAAGVFWFLSTGYGVPGTMLAFALAVTLLNTSYYLPLLVLRRDLVVFYRPAPIVAWGAAVAAGFAVSNLLALGIQDLPVFASRAGLFVLSALLAGIAIAAAVLISALLGIGEVRAGLRWLRSLATGRRRPASRIPNANLPRGNDVA
jgi:putative peptidoglycan lipid II flippase